MSTQENVDVKEFVTDNKAKSAYRWGIASIICWLLPVVGFPVAIVAIVKSLDGKKSKNFVDKAKLAEVFGWVGLGLSVVNAVAGLFMK